MCYKQKCKVVSLNLAHPVYYTQQISERDTVFNSVCLCLYVFQGDNTHHHKTFIAAIKSSEQVENKWVSITNWQLHHPRVAWRL